MSTDAIVLLKDDHKDILRAFREFEKKKDESGAARQQVVEEIIELLTVHTYLENEVMYPRVRELLPELEADVLESYEEHHVADGLVMELSTMRPDDDHYVAKTTVLIENVRHHIDEEESEWFPQVRQGLSRKVLQQMGAHMLRLREDAPRRPSQPSAFKKAIDAVVS